MYPDLPEANTFIYNNPNNPDNPSESTKETSTSKYLENLNNSINYMKNAGFGYHHDNLEHQQNGEKKGQKERVYSYVRDRNIKETVVVIPTNYGMVDIGMNNPNNPNNLSPPDNPNNPDNPDNSRLLSLDNPL